MEDTLPPTTQPQPQPMADRPLAEIEPEQTKKKSFLVPILLGTAVLLLGGVFGLLLRQGNTKLPSETVAPLTPTPTNMQTTNQPLSAIASTSAFTQTETGIASLSAAAAALNVADTTLNPPSLDLPLGLETK